MLSTLFDIVFSGHMFAYGKEGFLFCVLFLEVDICFLPGLFFSLSFFSLPVSRMYYTFLFLYLQLFDFFLSQDRRYQGVLLLDDSWMRC